MPPNIAVPSSNTSIYAYIERDRT